jgi:hypothetical protein
MAWQSRRELAASSYMTADAITGQICGGCAKGSMHGAAAASLQRLHT